MSYRSIALVLCIVVFVGMISPLTARADQPAAEAAATAKADFFVSPEGNDFWSGRLPAANADKSDGPFATLCRARDAVRALKKNESLQEAELLKKAAKLNKQAKQLKKEAKKLNGKAESLKKEELKKEAKKLQGQAEALINEAQQQRPLTVMLRGGRYFLEEPIVFGAADSGSRSGPITYTAYPGERPRLSGGRVVAGWKPYKGEILQCDWPLVEGGPARLRQLFYNGQRQIRARVPNFDPQKPLKGGWAEVRRPASPGNMMAFQYKKPFKNHWAKPTQAEVNIFHGHCGVNSIIPVWRWDSKWCIIRLSRPTIGEPLPGIRPENEQLPLASFWDRSIYHAQCGSIFPGNRFIIENLLEELDQPGEWCWDTDAGKLYFWPPDGEFESSEVTVPQLSSLIDLQGASFLQISGLTFVETTGGDNFFRAGGTGHGPMFPQEGLRYCGEAVRLAGTKNCIIENCVFDALGGNGVYIEGHSLRNQVRHNTLGDLGACGVVALGSKEKYPLFNRIEDNHIHHTGVFNKFSAGVFLGVSGGTFVNHNLIEYTPHHAINLGSNIYGRNFVEYNRIRHACMETRDTGAINVWMEMGGPDGRNVPRQGHVLAYNLFTDCSEKGIYLDNDASNCFVFGNVFVRLPYYVIAIHGGKNNVIENNVIVDASKGPGVGIYDYLTPPLLRANTIRRNIFVKAAQAIKVTHHAGPDYTTAESDYNLFFELPEGEAFLTQRQAAGYEEHSLMADPMFVDAEKDDYRLKPQSPALKLGFQPIDFERIGPRSGGEK